MVNFWAKFVADFCSHFVSKRISKHSEGYGQNYMKYLVAIANVLTMKNMCHFWERSEADLDPDSGFKCISNTQMLT